jgi:hypothetical protein
MNKNMAMPGNIVNAYLRGRGRVFNKAHKAEINPGSLSETEGIPLRFCRHIEHRYPSLH